uniref:Uncharacterized protein n=1 Tax=Onchocerca volvulus TaxID=6282 RepID=A0A8R1TQ60_ONCVO
MTADFDAVMGSNNSGITEKQTSPYGGRLKRGTDPNGPYEHQYPRTGATGQKEMLRNWWQHISLLLLPMSMSWMKSILY